MSATFVGVEEYLRTSYEPDMEYVDGVLIPRNVGAQLHGLLHTIVGAYLHAVRTKCPITAFSSVRVQMDQAGRRYRIPDIAVLEKPYTRGKVVTDVPSIVVEVKSPDDTFDEVIEKCLEYSALGVSNIVVLDPDNKRQYVFRKNALELVSQISLHLPKSKVDLPFPTDAMFAELDND